MRKSISFFIFLFSFFITFYLYNTYAEERISLSKIASLHTPQRMVKICFSAPVKYSWYLSEDKKLLVIRMEQEVNVDTAFLSPYIDKIDALKIQCIPKDPKSKVNIQVDYISLHTSSLCTFEIQDVQNGKELKVVLLSAPAQGVAQSQTLSQDKGELNQVLDDYINVKNQKAQGPEVAYRSSQGSTETRRDVPIQIAQTSSPSGNAATTNDTNNSSSGQHASYQMSQLLDLVAEQQETSARIELYYDTSFSYTVEYQENNRIIVLRLPSPIFTDLNKEIMVHGEVIQKINLIPAGVGLSGEYGDAFYTVNAVVITCKASVEYEGKDIPEENKFLITLQKGMPATQQQDAYGQQDTVIQKHKAIPAPVQDQNKVSTPAVSAPSSSDFPLPDVPEQPRFVPSDSPAASFSEPQSAPEQVPLKPTYQQQENTSAVVTPSLPPQEAAPLKEAVPGAPILLEVSCENHEDTAQVKLSADVPYEYKESKQENPYRVVIAPLIPLYTDSPQKIEVGKGMIVSVTLVSGAIKRPPEFDESFYAVEAVVIHTRCPVTSIVEQKGGDLIIGLQQKQTVREPVFSSQRGPLKEPKLSPTVTWGDAHRTSPKELFQEAEALKVNEVIPSFSKGNIPELAVLKKQTDRVLGFSPQGRNLEECIEIAFFNNRQVRVLKEEMKLARMKMVEARRALFPNLKIKGALTDGITSGANFREERLGVEAEQPIYYSGRLVLTYKQAKLNYQVSVKKFDKMKLEISQKVTEAFYNLQKSYANYAQQISLLKKGEYIFRLTNNLYKKELVTELELLNVQSQIYQVSYQVMSAKRDLDLNRLKLQKELNLLYEEEAIDIRPDFEFKEVSVDIQDALELAFAHRPDVYINNLLVKVGYLGEKIAKAKENYRVTVSGFLGASGSAYTDTESIRFKEDYSLGVKVQKNFGGNNADYSFSTNRTAPKLGQNERTRSTSHEVSFGILDGLSGLDEIQKAHIDFLKALDDKITLDDTVRVEVRESYVNYKKALMQLENISNKIKIKWKELRVTKLQVAYQEGPQSKLLESYIRIVEEFIQYNDTLNNYKNALNNLNKAIGLEDYYRC